MCHQKGYKNIFRLYIIDDGLGASNLLWSPSIGVFGFSSLPLHAGVVLGAAGRLRPVDALEQVLYRYYGTGIMVQRCPLRLGERGLGGCLASTERFRVHTASPGT